MQQGTSPVPIVVALIVAVIGAAFSLFCMDFSPHGTVRNNGINEIGRAALARAGATETPTQRNE